MDGNSTESYRWLGDFNRYTLTFTKVSGYNGAIQNTDKERNAMNESIGKRIARIRKAKNMTQEDLAGLVGVSSQAVSK